MRTGIIYAYTHKATGRMYVGQTIRPNERHAQHVKWRDSKMKIDRALLKYGAEAFEYQVIAADVPENELNCWEQFYVWQFHAYGHGFNMTPGGGFDSEYIRKMVQSPEWRLKTSIAIKNKYNTDIEYKKRVKQSAIKRAKNPKWAELNKLKLQEIRSKPEYIEKMKNHGKILATNKEWLMKMKTINMEKAKAVYCIESRATYLSSREAERQTSINNSKIIACCRGSRKTTGGYHWRYATPEEIAEFRAKQEREVQ
jgi:group I intron endonuclease